ncbi:MAG: ATP-binding cassette domain-containing protein [Chlorobi bacterium]|nr:ATP-binding cassette domain-containing protein [Chlorobiota bacterium]
MRDLSFAFPDGHVVFESINIQFPDRQLIRLHGVSGSGKSTLLRLIARLLAPTSGDIMYRGISTHEMDPLYWRKEIRYVQQVPVVPDSSVRSFLVFGLKMMKKAIPPDDVLYEHMHHLFDEDISLDASARNLSIGQQQRLGLLRAAMTDPDVLLFDEPTSALDGAAERQVEEWILNMHVNEGRNILVATHRDLLRDTDCIGYSIEQASIRREP